MSEHGTITIHGENGEIIGLTLKGGPTYWVAEVLLEHLRVIARKFGLVVVIEEGWDRDTRCGVVSLAKVRKTKTKK